MTVFGEVEQLNCRLFVVFSLSEHPLSNGLLPFAYNYFPTLYVNSDFFPIFAFAKRISWQCLLVIGPLIRMVLISLTNQSNVRIGAMELIASFCAANYNLQYGSKLQHIAGLIGLSLAQN